MSRLSKTYSEKRGEKSYLLNNVLRTEDVHIAAFSFIRRVPFSERNLFPRLFVASAMGMLLAASATVSAQPPRLLPTDALIENTGSTNTTGYTIYVAPNGHVQYGAAAYPMAIPPGVKLRPGTLSPNAAKKLFQDLSTAMPLASLPVRHGMRSASFGTQTYITYKGQQSPDLTFASDPRTAALKADIDTITKTLHIGNAPKHPIILEQTTQPANGHTF